MGGATQKHGTRFELFLEQSDGSARAVYRAEVRKPDATWNATVEITSDGACIVTRDEGLDDALASQLVALAKTLGKRAEDSPWPRRVQRWREPGVR